MDHLSSGRRERSDSTDFNQASTAYMTDPRTYDPSYSNSGHGSTNNEDAKTSMYQPTIYDPQYSQPDYWQVQAQQWKVMQAANGDPSSVSSPIDSSPALGSSVVVISGSLRTQMEPSSPKAPFLNSRAQA